MSKEIAVKCGMCLLEYRGEHPDQECIAALRKQIDAARASINDWQNAWYDQREVIGRLSWTVPNLAALKQSSSEFLQRQFQKAKEMMGNG